MPGYEGIGQYIQFLQRRYNLHVCVKDFSGFVAINKNLDTVLQPYLAHTNPFCMYIKHERKPYLACIAMMRRMHGRCLASPGFLGYCHAGLGECVVPVVHGGTLLGTVNAGFFSPGEKRLERRIQAVCGTSQALCATEAKELYRQHITPPEIGVGDLLPHLQVLAGYLALSYANLQLAHGERELDTRNRYSGEDSILSHAVNYLQKNFAGKVTVGEIAGYCHCSESYLSRIFKKRTGLNINSYVNKMRVEHAKRYLVETGDSIFNISLNTGFADPNYFSRVFSEMVRMSPTEYRKRFTKG